MFKEQARAARPDGRRREHGPRGWSGGGHGRHPGSERAAATTARVRGREGWRAGRCRHRCDDGGRTIGEGRRARGHTHAARGYVTGSSERLSVSRAIGAGRHAIERWWWWWWRRTSPSPSCDASGVSPRTRANQVAYSPGGGVTLDLARALAARGPRVRCGAGADHGARERVERLLRGPSGTYLPPLFFLLAHTRARTLSFLFPLFLFAQRGQVGRVIGFRVLYIGALALRLLPIGYDYTRGADMQRGGDDCSTNTQIINR